MEMVVSSVSSSGSKFRSSSKYPKEYPRPLGIFQVGGKECAGPVSQPDFHHIILHGGSRYAGTCKKCHNEQSSKQLFFHGTSQRRSLDATEKYANIHTNGPPHTYSLLDSILSDIIVQTGGRFNQNSTADTAGCPVRRESGRKHGYERVQSRRHRLHRAWWDRDSSRCWSITPGSV